MHRVLSQTLSEHEYVFDLVRGKPTKEEFIHQTLVNPQFFNLAGGGPRLTDSQGNPWSANYVNANADLTVDLRSDIAAESRAKIVYEYLLQFTDDPGVRETLKFLMTREVAHLQMFAAALDSIQPNFPPGVMQGDPRYTHKYFNMSDGANARGDWNQGQGPWGDGESWNYIENPISHVRETAGETTEDTSGSSLDMEEAERKTRDLSRQRSEEIRSSIPRTGGNQWSEYPQTSLHSPENPGRQ